MFHRITVTLASDFAIYRMCPQARERGGREEREYDNKTKKKKQNCCSNTAVTSKRLRLALTVTLFMKRQS